MKKKKHKEYKYYITALSDTSEIKIVDKKPKGEFFKLVLEGSKG